MKSDIFWNFTRFRGNLLVPSSWVKGQGSRVKQYSRMLDPSIWAQYVVLRRRFEPTILRCVKLPKLIIHNFIIGAQGNYSPFMYVYYARYMISVDRSRRPQPCNVCFRPYCSIHLCRHSSRQQRSLVETSTQFSAQELKKCITETSHSLCVCVCLHPLVLSKRLTIFHKTCYVTFEETIQRRRLYLFAVGNTNALDARTFEVESFSNPVCVQVLEVMCGLRARKVYVHVVKVREIVLHSVGRFHPVYRPHRPLGWVEV